MSSWTVASLARGASDFLRGRGVDSHRLDADLLVAHALGLKRIDLYLQRDREVTEQERSALRPLVRRRGQREPLAYILGEREFWSLRFEVGPGVLVPRPETELLVEWGLEILKPRPRREPVSTPDQPDEAKPSAPPVAAHELDGELSYELEEEEAPAVAAPPTASQLDGELSYELEEPGAEAPSPTEETAPPESEALVADIGTGSGCLAIALSKETGARVIAVEREQAARGWAERNIAAHELGRQVALRLGDGFAAIPSRFRGRLDLVVSNPPYIPAADRARLAPEVGDHEPASALFGGEDGLDLVKRLVAEAPSWLKPGGWLLLEIGQGQAQGVAGLMRSAGLVGVEVRKDYAGIERLVGGRTGV